MDDLEQSERVREWLRTNGSAITTGIVVGIAGIVGIQWWQHSTQQHRVDAATTFQALQRAADSQDQAQFEQLAGELGDTFGNTPYGALALMQLANEKATKGDLEAAATALEQAAKAAQNQALTALAQLRLARLKLAAGDAQAALDLLAKLPADEFAGLAAELRGDALMVLQRPGDAETAYQDALSKLETGAPNRTIVQMKLADLGVGDTEPGA